jgi:hypothetical protein
MRRSSSSSSSEGTEGGELRVTLRARGFFALEEEAPPTSWECLTHFSATQQVLDESDIVL